MTQGQQGKKTLKTMMGGRGKQSFHREATDFKCLFFFNT